MNSVKNGLRLLIFWWSRRQLSRRMDLAFLDTIQLKPRKIGDYWFLWKQVIKQRPKYIVEFGSGASTVVLADAARRVGAELLSFEHDENWFKWTRKQIQSYPRAEVFLLPWLYRAKSFSRYKRSAQIIGKQPVGLVFIDGPPAPRSERAVNMDVFDLLSSLSESAVVIIDGRCATVERLRYNFWWLFKVRNHRLLEKTVFCKRQHLQVESAGLE